MSMLDLMCLSFYLAYPLDVVYFHVDESAEKSVFFSLLVLYAALFFKELIDWNILIHTFILSH